MQCEEDKDAWSYVRLAHYLDRNFDFLEPILLTWFDTNPKMYK